MQTKGLETGNIPLVNENSPFQQFYNNLLMIVGSHFQVELSTKSRQRVSIVSSCDSENHVHWICFDSDIPMWYEMRPPCRVTGGQDLQLHDPLADFAFASQAGHLKHPKKNQKMFDRYIKWDHHPASLIRPSQTPKKTWQHDIFSCHLSVSCKNCGSGGYSLM